MKNKLLMPSIVFVCASGWLATCMGITDWDIASEDDELALLDAETDCSNGNGDVCYSLDEKDCKDCDKDKVDGGSSDGSGAVDGSAVDGGSGGGGSGGHGGHDSEARKACKQAAKISREKCLDDSPFPQVKIDLKECHNTYKTCVETTPDERKQCRKDFKACRKAVKDGIPEDAKETLHDCMHECKDKLRECIDLIP